MADSQGLIGGPPPPQSPYSIWCTRSKGEHPLTPLLHDMGNAVVLQDYTMTVSQLCRFVMPTAAVLLVLFGHMYYIP